MSGRRNQKDKKAPARSLEAATLGAILLLPRAIFALN
jgi:hypothetical protein